MKIDFPNELHFKASLSRFADELPKEHLLPLQKRVVGEVANGCIFGTPVLTGRARGAWMLEHDRPVAGEPGRLDTGGTLAEAAINFEMLEIKPFEVSYIGNDVPYIVPLEKDGHSPQNRGWVKATVAAVNAKFR